MSLKKIVKWFKDNESLTIDKSTIFTWYNEKIYDKLYDILIKIIKVLLKNFMRESIHLE